MSAINPVTTQTYVPPVSGPSTANTSLPPVERPELQDAVVLSLAGRIALGVGAGRLTSDQAKQLTSELKTITQTTGTDRTKLESQLSQEIYGDGHNGATIPADLKVTTAEKRDFVQAGRIVAQEGADNITHSQATQLFSQMKEIYQASQNGASAAATNKAQNQLSIEIYDAAHNITPEPKQ
jgi:hypothetical protein